MAKDFTDGEWRLCRENTATWILILEYKLQK